MDRKKIKNNRLVTLLTIVFLMCLIQSADSQQMVRSSISSFGHSLKTDDCSLQTTGGQSGLTNVSSNNGLFLRQGFNQPIEKVLFKNEIFQINVYPNPTTEYFQIQTNPEQIYSYNLYDQMGKLMMSKENVKGSNSVNVSTCSAGDYVLMLSSGTQHQSVKINLIK
jgi:hypothetical protein